MNRVDPKRDPRHREQAWNPVSAFSFRKSQDLLTRLARVIE